MNEKRLGHPRFHQILDEMRMLHDNKNQDYAGKADSLANFRECERWGLKASIGAFTRLSDKYCRIVQLLRKEQEGGGGPAVSTETINDTLMDLANYSVLTRVLREEEMQERIRALDPRSEDLDSSCGN